MWRRCLDDGRPLLRVRLHAREPDLQGPRAQGPRRPERPPARRREGYVAGRDGDGDYAMRKGNAVHLLLVEATGTISPVLHLLLCALAPASNTPEAGDSTCYGKRAALRPPASKCTTPQQ
eukprot:1931577-Prymnesium_polylepis.1